jgi:hypothetical protein
MAADHSLAEALLRARKLLLDLERHLDRAAQEAGLAEVGRAWVRAAQLERLLRSMLPPGATDVAEAEAAAAPARRGSGDADPPVEVIRDQQP